MPWLIYLFSLFTGEKKFFMGTEPCELDCAAFGQLVQYLYNTPDGCPGKQILKGAQTHTCGYREGTGGPDPIPMKNHKVIGFLSNTGPDSLKNDKTTQPAFNVKPSSARQRNAIMLMAFRWLVEDGPLLVGFKTSFFSHPHQLKYKKRFSVGSPLTKLSGSAHAHIRAYLCENLNLLNANIKGIDQRCIHAVRLALLLLSLYIAWLRNLPHANLSFSNCLLAEQSSLYSIEIIATLELT